MIILKIQKKHTAKLKESYVIFAIIGRTTFKVVLAISYKTLSRIKIKPKSVSGTFFFFFFLV